MHFIIKTGYNPSDFIRINDMRDLEKAQLAFLTNSKTIFENGEVVRGQDIISIREDWHAEMGWNTTYRDEDGRVRPYELGDDDWVDIRSKGIDKKYLGVLAGVKAKVIYLMETGQEKLVGKGVAVGLPEKPPQIQTGVLADKLRI